jgi:chromosomal replication initiator protein
MRRQILLDKANRRDLVLDDEVVSYMADHLRSNARELEGAINYLSHYASAWESSCIDLPAAQSALTDVIQLATPRLTVADVAERACRIYGLEPARLREKSRAHAVAHPRMLVLYLARRYTTATYREIGSQFGDLNHSAAIAAEKRIRTALAADETILLANRRWSLREAIDAFQREFEPRENV